MKSFITLLFILIAFAAQAQTNISGTISDKKGDVVIGASVAISGSYDGTTSDLDGKYNFQTEETGTQILSISSLGYESQEIEINISGESLEFNFRLIDVITELNAVVISAGAFEASDRKKAVVLKSIDIATTAGATADISGALNTLPGTQRVGEEGQLFVRGGAAYETRTFIDGMRVQNPYNSSIPNVPARNRFSPFLFKGTTFSTGGYSAEYGQALSSALILETQDLAKETVTGISLMSVGLGLAHTQRWENSSLAISGDYTNLTPYASLVPQNITWDKPWRGENGTIAYRQKTSETGMLKLNLAGSHSSMALQYPDMENLPETSSIDLTNHHLDFNGSYREILGEKWSIFSGVTLAQNKDQINQNFQVTQNEQSAQVKSTIQYHASESFSLKLGASHLYNQFNEVYTNSNEPSIETTLKENQSAAFAEASIRLNKKFATRVGIRAEYSSLLQMSNIAPRISIAYKLSDHGQIAAAYGSFFQNPENEWLRYNQDLGFEKAQHLMLNYQFMKEGYVFRVEGYFKKYDDLIKFPENTPWFSQNSGQGFAKGIDVFFRDKKTFKRADYWISYSYLDTEREYLDFPTASAPRFASPHNLSVVYKHWFPKWTTFAGLTYSYSSPRIYNDPNTLVFNDQKTSAFHDLSFNASYLTQLFGQFTVVYISASNILGLEQSFGERFSNTTDSDGQYASVSIRPPAKRFFFVGCFISIGQEPYKKED